MGSGALIQGGENVIKLIGGNLAHLGENNKNKISTHAF